MGRYVSFPPPNCFSFSSFELRQVSRSLSLFFLLLPPSPPCFHCHARLGSMNDSLLHCERVGGRFVVGGRGGGGKERRYRTHHRQPETLTSKKSNNNKKREDRAKKTSLCVSSLSLKGGMDGTRWLSDLLLRLQRQREINTPPLLPMHTSHEKG